MTITFIGLLPDNTIIKKNSLEELNRIPYIKCFFRVVSHSRPRKSPDYYPINSDGADTTLSRGDFEIIDISDVSESGFYGRKIRVFEKSTQRSFEFQTGNKNWGYSFITDELLPLLDDLEKHGSCEKYLEHLELVQLKDENAALRAKVAEQQTIINELEHRLATASEPVNTPANAASISAE